MTPKVSIIIPVHNAELYLRECLESVLHQKAITDIEVICVDDGSTDCSPQIIREWSEKDDRVTVISQKNQGPGVARNVALDVARGEYILFVDADDRLESGAALDRAYQQAKADSLDVLVSSAMVMTDSGKVFRETCLNEAILPQGRVFAPKDLGANLYVFTVMSPWGKLLCRNFIETKKLRFPELQRSEDFPMIQLALSLASRIGCLSEPFYSQRIGVTSSLESTKDETPLIFFDAEQLFRGLLKKYHLWMQYKDAANVAFTVRLAYNIRAVRKYASFKSIVCKMQMDYRGKLFCISPVLIDSYIQSNVIVEKLMETDISSDNLVQHFVDLQQHKMIKGLDASFKDELVEVRKKLAKAYEDREELKGKLANAWAMHDRVKAELMATRTKLSSAYDDREGLKGKLANAWAMYDRVKAELMATRTKLSSAYDDREGLKGKLANAWAKYDELKLRWDFVTRLLNSLNKVVC